MLKTEVLPQEAGKVRLVFRHYPLSFHPWARAAAEVTACAADQNNDIFWRLHDYIFERQPELTPDNVRQKLIDEAKRSRGFDQTRLSRCLAEKKVASRIDQDIAFGTQAGVQGTPTVFVNGFRATAVSSAVQIRSLIREQSRAPQAKPVAMAH
jgi:protein-disulfide isomerase